VWLLLVSSAPAQQQGIPWQQMEGWTELCAAERGELAPESTDLNPVLRFGVSATQRTGWLKFEGGEHGFLYVSRDRIRYSPGAFNKQGSTLDTPRSDLKNSKDWYGFAELQFRSSGKWLFMRLQCSPEGGTSRDVLEALQNFATAYARVKPITEARRQAEAKARAEEVAKAARAEEARLAREAEARKSQVATLRVTTQPGQAQVYLDDKFRGSTSEKEGVLLIDLPPGTYRLRISYLGYKDWAGEATLAGGETRTVEARLVAAGPKSMTVEEVEEALKSGVAKSRLMGFVTDYGVDFALTDEIEQRLRAVGADSDLLLAIAKAKK